MSDYERQDSGYDPTSASADLGSQGEARGDKSPEEIEREIEMTRERMSRNIDELGERLSPQHLKTQAQTAIRDAAHGAVSNVGEQARQTGSRIVDLIRENPIPVMAVGVGVTWLLTQRSPNNEEVSGDQMARYAYSGPERRTDYSGIRGKVARKVSDAVSGVREATSDVAGGVADRAGELKERVQERAGTVRDRVGERASDLGSQTREQTRRLKTNLEHAIEENPLVVAAGAAIVGLALGLLLPSTEREDALMGPARDQLVDRAQAAAERVKDVASEAGREVAETVRSEIAERGPEVKEVVRDAAQTVKQQVKESATRVTQEAKEAAQQPPSGTGGKR